MSHYHIIIGISETEVKLLRKELTKFLEDSGGVTIRLGTDNPVEDSEKLQALIKELFVRLLIVAGTGEFGKTQVH